MSSRNSLRGKRILVGVSGGIAAYKTPELVRRLVDQGARVDVVMTPHAAQFVSPLSLQVVSRNPVLLDLFDRKGRAEVRHIALADAADLALLAPATANVLGKLAHGIADDALTTVFLAVRAPTLIAPAMNRAMWSHPATSASKEMLEKWGYRFIGPEKGFLAEGYTGMGRMTAPEKIVAEASRVIRLRGIAARKLGQGQRNLRGVQVVITAGAAQEPIAPGCLLSCEGDTSLGQALALEAQRRGARVTLICAGAKTDPLPEIRTLYASSSAELVAACKRVLPKASILVHTATLPSLRARRGHGLELESATGLAPRLGSSAHGKTVVRYAHASAFAASREYRLTLHRDSKDAFLLSNGQLRPPRGRAEQLGPGIDEEIAQQIWDRVARDRGVRRVRRTR